MIPWKPGKKVCPLTAIPKWDTPAVRRCKSKLTPAEIHSLYACVQTDTVKHVDLVIREMMK